MIIDAFLYNGEAEYLDIRRHELAGVVDAHVALECDRTFTGLPRQVVGVDAPGVLHGVVSIGDGFTDPWQREAVQRNALLLGLQTCADDDIILIGDVDEIPSAAAVKEAAALAAQGHQVAFEQVLCLYYVNNVEPFVKWYGTQAVRYDYLKRVTPQGVRDFRNHTPYIVKDGGWHYSSLVLDDAVGRLTAKIQAFSHQEVNRPEILDPANIRERVALGQDIQGRTDVRFSVQRDATLPRYVAENKERWASLFYPGSL